MKLLKEKYKTYDGAHKRTGFENSLARFEFERGDKARHYKYRTEAHDGAWRVVRYTPEELTDEARGN